MGFFGSKTTDNSGSLGSNISVGGGYVTSDEIARRIQAQQLQQSAILSSPPHVYKSHYPDMGDEHYRKMMLAMRLRLHDGSEIPFQHLSTALADDKVFVFVVQNNQPVTFEDERGMYPSDTLVTQLRLIMK